MICPTANYSTELPNDHKFFSGFGVLEKDLSMVFVTTTIGLSEADGESGLPPKDYIVCSKVCGKTLGTGYGSPQ
jgi:hypothetical protein